MSTGRYPLPVLAILACFYFAHEISMWLKGLLR